MWTDKSNNQILNNYLIWLCMYLGVAVVIVFVTPFPFSIYASLLVLFLLNMIRSRVALRRSNETMLSVLQKWLTSVGNNSKVATSIGVWHIPMRFYCVYCGNEHNKIACRQCGSKAIRMG
jgi:hypothetical protein